MSTTICFSLPSSVWDLLAKLAKLAEVNLPTDAVDRFKLLALVLGGVWALTTFRRNNRIKAAELLLKLEEECRLIQVTMLGLESNETYATRYEPAIKKCLPTEALALDLTETEDIDRLERALRHLDTCARVKGLGVDAGALDRAYAYYLHILVSKERPDLQKYVDKYWRHVEFWAELAGTPWPLKWLLFLGQIPRRIGVWLRGSYPTSMRRSAALPREQWPTPPED